MALSVPADDLDTARRVLMGEADALRLLAARLDGSFVRALDLLQAATGRVICAGIGKSGHVARKIAATLASTGAPSQFVHPNEASHGDLGMISTADVVVMLSRSGQNAELDDVITYTRRFEVPLIAITARPESPLGRAADVVLAIPDVPEACGETNAPTTSTTLMMALGDALAVALLERRGFRAEDFKILHPGGRLGAMLLTARDIMHTGESVPLVASGAALASGLEVISRLGMGCVGVVDGAGDLTGVITDGDVRRLLSAGRTVATVDDAMTRHPFVVSGEVLAANVLRMMNDRKITQVFVVDGAGAPSGIVHLHDLLKAGLA